MLHGLMRMTSGRFSDERVRDIFTEHPNHEEGTLCKQLRAIPLRIFERHLGVVSAFPFE